MKLSTVLAVLFFISSNAFAAPLATCHTEMDSWDETPVKVISDFEILDKKAIVTQTKGSDKQSFEQAVEIVEGTIRPGLDKIAKAEVDATASNTEIKSAFDDQDLKLNEVEKLVLHAMIIQLETPMRSGMDLTLGTSGKAYLLGEKTGMGQAALIDVMGADGKSLGSFLGGFLVSACK